MRNRPEGETYEGVPCRKKQHTTRYVSTGACVECVRGYNKALYDADPQGVCKEKSESRQKHLDKALTREAEWRDAKKEHMKEKKEEWLNKDGNRERANIRRAEAHAAAKRG